MHLFLSPVSHRRLRTHSFISALNSEAHTPSIHATPLTPCTRTVLLRPGMYIGSIECVESTEWVLAPDRCSVQRSEVRWSPALQTLFDEIVVNAADNAARDPAGTTRIDVVVSSPGVAPASITVRNNGRGIPVQVREGERCGARARRERESMCACVCVCVRARGIYCVR